MKFVYLSDQRRGSKLFTAAQVLGADQSLSLVCLFHFVQQHFEEGHKLKS